MKSKDTKAWSKKFWIAVQKTFNKPSVEHGLSEMDYLFRAVIRKKQNVLAFKPGGYAIWSVINDNDLKKWQTFMRIWGWYDQHFTWDPELEEHLLRSSIRAFALHPDGPLPPVLCQGAKKRLADLQAELDKLNQSSAWKKLNFEDFTWAQRFDSMALWDTYEWEKRPFDVKKAWAILQELNWKQKTSLRIQDWLIKKGTIPMELAQDWINVWKYDFKTASSIEQS